MPDRPAQIRPSVSFIDSLNRLIPDWLKNLFNPLISYIVPKYGAELYYWKTKFRLENGHFANEHYKEIMLAMAGQKDEEFLTGKTVADFGCGPRGSLAWVKNAGMKIGIDVLADRYIREFSEDILKHGMVYLKSTEKRIPLPAGSVDILYTMNALDHVNSLPEMCSEIIRVLKPGGSFYGSFNINEPKAPCEPQTLTEVKIQQHLLDKLTVISYRITPAGDPTDPYQPFLLGDFNYQPGQKGILWIQAEKPE